MLNDYYINIRGKLSGSAPKSIGNQSDPNPIKFPVQNIIQCQKIIQN